MKFDADYSFWLIELLLPTARRLSLRTLKLAKTKLVVNGKITALNKQVCLTRIISHVMLQKTQMNLNFEKLLAQRVSANPKSIGAILFRDCPSMPYYFMFPCYLYLLLML